MIDFDKIGAMLKELGDKVAEFFRNNRLATYGGGAVAILLLLALFLRGGETATDTAEASLAGTWKISYADRVLGAVTGAAIVSDAEDSVTVRLVHPLTGARTTLRSTAFAREDGTLRVTLEGEGPSVRNFADPALGQYLDVGEGTPYQRQGPDRITVTMGEASTTVTAMEPEQSSRQRIELELAIAESGLTGTWRQIVHPETGRDENNAGRIGEFRFLNDGTGLAEQNGRESWSRPDPIIRLVMPHADQYARSLTGDAAHPYPWNEDGSLVAPIADRRYLLVLGEDLPIELGETASFTSSNPNINYVLDAKPSQLGDMMAASAMVAAAWKRVEDDLRQQILAVSPGGTITAAGEAAIAQTMRELRELDFVLVRAELAQGAVPGRTDFTLNGANGTWALNYGDFNATMTFARPMPAGPDETAISEPLDFAYAPDKVYLEIRTAREFPFESVPVQVWVNGRPRLFNGFRDLTAVRLPITEADRDNLAYRRERVRAAGGDPDTVEMLYTYRSPALALLTAGAPADSAGNVPGVEGDYRIAVQTGDVVRGVFGSPDKFLVTPAIAEIRVAASPAEVSSLTLGPDADNNLTWTRALTEAAACVSVPLVQTTDEQGNTSYDWNALARRPSQTFTNVIILNATTTSLTMNVGDHAAMLMLRDVFVEMMIRQARNLEAIDSPAEIAAFRAQSEVAVANVPNHPLAEIDVPTPSGGTLPFELTYASDELLFSRFGIAPENVEQWRRTATASLIAQYVAQIRRSLELAQGIDPCEDIEELIELTGRGFDGVYRYALGRLVTAEETALAPGDYWKPDLAARAWLLGVPTFADALSAQQAYSAADTRAVITATAIATSAVALSGGLLAVGATYLGAAEATGAVGSLAYGVAVLSEVGPALAMAVDFITAAASIESAVSEKYEATAEVNFARGTALAIGMARLDQAVENDPSYARLFTRLYIELAPIAVGTAFSVDDAFRSIARYGQPSSLGPAARKITEGGLRTLAQDDAVTRGRELFGDAAADASIATAARPAAAAEPPRIPAGEFDQAFPDAQGIANASSLGVDDLRNPANPNVLATGGELSAQADALLEGGVPPPGVFEGADTIIPGGAAAALPEGVPSPFPPGGGPPPGFSGSGTNVELPTANPGTPAAPRSIAELEGMRAQVDEIYENARREAQATLDAGGDLGGLQTTRLEGDAQLYMVHDILDDAVAEARRAGLTDAEIDSILAARANMENPMAARYALIRDLEYAAVQRLGYEILTPEEATGLFGLITRATNSAENAAPVSALDLDRLKQWIDDYAQQGRDFFDELQRMGTFSDFVEDAATMNPGSGFEAIVYGADDIAALRRIAEDNGLLPDLTSTTVLNARRTATSQVDDLADVRALPDADRVNAFAAMVDARRIALEVGEEALDAAERVAYRVANEALNEGVESLPQWARGLDRATYDIIEPLSRRADIRAFAEANPSQFSAIARDPDRMIALSRRPYANLEELAAEIEKERRRIKTAVEGFYDQTGPARQNLDDFAVSDEVYNMRDFDPDFPDVRVSTSKILVDGNEVGTFQRELELLRLPDGREGRQLVLAYSNGKHAPRFIRDLEVPLIRGRDTPLATFMNVRAFHNLEIPFGDPSLVSVKMSNVLNANTSVEIDWMRRVYGENFADYLRHTHSVRYAESALNQAGFRITGVRLVGGRPSPGTARAMVMSEFYNAVEEPLEFLARYGVDPDSKIVAGFDIYIDIAPL